MKIRIKYNGKTLVNIKAPPDDAKRLAVKMVEEYRDLGYDLNRIKVTMISADPLDLIFKPGFRI